MRADNQVCRTIHEIPVIDEIQVRCVNPVHRNAGRHVAPLIAVSQPQYSEQAFFVPVRVQEGIDGLQPQVPLLFYQAADRRHSNSEKPITLAVLSLSRPEKTLRMLSYF